MMQRAWGWILVAGVVAGPAACAKESAYEKPLTPVQVTTVAPAAATEGLRYSAGVAPNVRVDLAFKAGGYIEELARVGGRAIQDGDPVRRGMILARVRSTDYAEKVTQARSQLAEAEAASTATKQAYDRASQLYQSHSITRPEFEQAQAALDTVKAKISGARALVQEAENARKDTALVSPIDGIVVKRLIEVGSLVGPGSGGFVLADTSSVKIVFGAPDTLLHSLKVGAVETVTSEAVPNRRFEGHITKVAPTADPETRVFDVEITVPNHDGALRAGMVAVAQVDVPAGAGATRQAAIAVPLSAIVRSPDRPDAYVLFVVEGDGGGATIVRRRNVTLGDMVGNEIAVVGGLRAGDRVVITGATIVNDGERVRVVS